MNVDKHLNRAAEEERMMFEDPERAEDHRRKANLFFKAAMKADGTPMDLAEKVI